MICEMCGCTDERACIHLNGEPCHWTRPGLCSACDEVEGPGPALRSWPLPESDDAPPADEPCVAIGGKAERVRAAGERIQAGFAESWRRAHGEESTERLGRKLENAAAWLAYIMPASHAEARAHLKRSGVRVPNPAAMRRIMRVRRFVAALRATDPKGKLS